MPYQEKCVLEYQRSAFAASVDNRSGSPPAIDPRLVFRNKEEQVVLDFSRYCGFLFEKPEPLESPSQYFLRMKGNKLVYSVYAINDFSSEKKKSFSILLRSPIRESEIFLLCKGQEDYMRSRLLLERHESEMLEAVLSEMHASGLKPLIYARRVLPELEAMSFISKSRNLKTSLLNQAGELAELALELERELSLVAVVGLRDELNEGVEELMKFARSTDINVWMLTGDSRENALSTASSAKIIDGKQDKKKEITAEDSETVTLQVRSLLTEIKNIYVMNFFEIMDSSRKSVDSPKRSLRKSLTKSFQDFFLRKIENRLGRETLTRFAELKNRIGKEFLLVSGKAMDVIFRDPFLKPHFVFLLSLYKKVVAYDLTPRHKYLLTDTVQSLFIDNPSVMAIGDGSNDSLMLQTAHMGIELLGPSSFPFLHRPKVNSGDLQISSLSVLPSLMLFEGLRRLSNLENFLYLLFYKSFLIGWTLFLYNWFCSFTGTSLFSAIIVFLYSFFFHSFTLVIYVLFDKPVSESQLRKFPGLYKEALLKKRNLILRIVIKSIIEGLLHSFVIFYTIAMSLMGSLMSDGMQSDFTMISFALATTLIFVPNVKILFLCLGHNLKMILLGFCLVVFTYAAFIFLASHSLLGKGDWGPAMLNLMNNTNGICIIIFNIWFCQLISYIYERYILKKVLYSSVKEKSTDQSYLRSLTNEQILRDLEIQM